MAIADPKKKLLEEAMSFAMDPLGFVYWCFPWGVPGTPLEDYDGPDDWQAETLIWLGEELVKRDQNRKVTLPAIRGATASGRGIGKSAFFSWIPIFLLSTRIAPNIVVTANTATQLATKTWRELAKWHRLAKNSDWFTWTATKFYLTGRPEDAFAQAIPWSKDKPEASSGTHADTVCVLMDESSSIEDVIFETIDATLTDREAIWLTAGNPTRNTGRFHKSFHRDRRRWHLKQVDSRTCRQTNKTEIEDAIKAYGEDSDWVRINVKGQFPRAGSTQLIPVDIVEAAMGRDAEGYESLPVVMGVDIARHGDDETVFLFRQGQKILEIARFQDLDGMQVASFVAEYVEKWDPDGVIMESAGVGSGPLDRLRQLGYRVIDINPGGRAMKSQTYFNLRTEMWYKILDWLKAGGCLPDDTALRDDLIGPQYGFDGHNRFQLERKKDMKSRGLDSPDTGDALAMTFAVPVKATKKRRSSKFEIRPPTYDEMIREHEQNLRTDPDDQRI